MPDCSSVQVTIYDVPIKYQARLQALVDRIGTEYEYIGFHPDKPRCIIGAGYWTIQAPRTGTLHIEHYDCPWGELANYDPLIRLIKRLGLRAQITDSGHYTWDGSTQRWNPKRRRWFTNTAGVDGDDFMHWGDVQPMIEIAMAGYPSPATAMQKLGVQLRQWWQDRGYTYE